VADELPLNNPSSSAWLGRAMWIGVGLAIGLTILNVARPRPASKNTNTASASLPDDQAKVEFLKRYLKLPSEVQAAEFHILYQDNSKGMIPGPSDYDIRAVVKVPPDKVGLWTAEFRRTDTPYDVDWAYRLLPKEDRWAIRSAPAFYEREGVQVVTFEPEGIVFKLVSNQARVSPAH
jgi:hypothetical protein